MSELLRKEIPLGIAAFLIAYLFFDYYVFTEITRNIASIITDWAIIATTTAAGVGILNMVIRTYHRVNKRESYWYFDIWMLLMMVVMGVTGLIGVYGTHPMFTWVMMNVYLPIDASVYAMVMFDIVSAFYRTFRLRSKDAVILFVCAVIIMFKNAPLVGGLFPSFIPIGDWMLEVPSTAGSRAFTIVAAIGVIAFTIRTMLGAERPTLGVVE